MSTRIYFALVGIWLAINFIGPERVVNTVSGWMDDEPVEVVGVSYDQVRLLKQPGPSDLAALPPVCAETLPIKAGKLEGQPALRLGLCIPPAEAQPQAR